MGSKNGRTCSCVSNLADISDGWNTRRSGIIRTYKDSELPSALKTLCGCNLARIRGEGVIHFLTMWQVCKCGIRVWVLRNRAFRTTGITSAVHTLTPRIVKWRVHIKARLTEHCVGWSESCSKPQWQISSRCQYSLQVGTSWISMCGIYGVLTAARRQHGARNVNWNYNFEKMWKMIYLQHFESKIER